LLQRHLSVDLDELVVEVLPAPAQLIDLLRAEAAPLLLLLLEDSAPALHLERYHLTCGSTYPRGAVERNLRHGIARLHLVAFLDEELGHAAGIGDEDARGAGVEREIALDPLAARVLTPQC